MCLKSRKVPAVDVRSSSCGSGGPCFLVVDYFCDVGGQLVGLKKVSCPAKFCVVSFTWHRARRVASQHRRRREGLSCPTLTAVPFISVELIVRVKYEESALQSKSQISRGIRGSSAICDRRIRISTRNGVGEVMSEYSVGNAIGIASDIPGRQLRELDWCD